jgi:hypothetical protein
MDWPIAQRVIRDLKDLGCKAVTITGGGEPLMYPYINQTIEAFREADIKIGLVTNGLLLEHHGWAASQTTWCRISNSDVRTFTDEYATKLAAVCDNHSIDWAFSHVVTQTPNLEEIARIVEFANDHKFTHVRLVGDLFEPEVIDWGPIRDHLKGIDQLVIYQPRTEHISATECLLGYVKPVIGPDFKMYLCCGVQYAFDPPARDYPESLCMGSATDLRKIYAYPQPFNVSCCRCYYDDYNRILFATRNITHKEFV